jgi:hypothetical protein
MHYQIILEIDAWINVLKIALNRQMLPERGNGLNV